MGRDQLKHLQRTLHTNYLRNIPTILLVHIPIDLPFQPKFDIMFFNGAHDHVRSYKSKMNLHNQLYMQRLSYQGPLSTFQNFVGGHNTQR